MTMIVDLLLHPYVSGALSIDTPCVLVANCPYHSGFADVQTIEQDQFYYPYSKEWDLHGVTQADDAYMSDHYDLIFCALPQQQDFARYLIVRYFHALKQGGYLIVAAMNDAGGKRLPKTMNIFDNAQSHSKYKGRVIWAQKQEITPDRLKDWIISGQKQEILINNHTFITKPGVFGWNKEDLGSKLLLSHLPADISGIGADFGCGYGYLSHFLLNEYDSIQQLYLIDADRHAIDCAQENLRHHDQLAFYWADLTNPTSLPSLDFVIMNPPFHAGKDTQHSIGDAFIQQAYSCLKPNGRLFMVANQHLPYEKALNNLFKKAEKRIENAGFKVYEAVK